MSDERAKVVIIGAGFGGIEAAKALRRSPAEVTVIDRQNHHCFQPLLYQVATAALSLADVTWPIQRQNRQDEERNASSGRSNPTLSQRLETGERPAPVADKARPGPMQ
jgi:NADH dehydrogenase FAD-containing subunit